MSYYTRHRRDGNHDEIEAAYQAMGYKTKSTVSVGGGFGDMVIHRDDFPPGFVKIVEIKQPKGKLRKQQEAFQAKGWPVVVVRNVEDVQ